MKEVRASPGPQGLGEPPAPRGKQDASGAALGPAFMWPQTLSTDLWADSASGRQGWADAPPWEPRGASSPTAPRNPQRHVKSLELAARPQASHWAVFNYFLKCPSPYNLNQHTGCCYKSSVCPWQTSKCSRRAENGK